MTFFIFTPKIGEDEPILTYIFQRGWFNHQPGECGSPDVDTTEGSPSITPEPFSERLVHEIFAKHFP